MLGYREGAPPPARRVVIHGWTPLAGNTSVLAFATLMFAAVMSAVILSVTVDPADRTDATAIRSGIAFVVFFVLAPVAFFRLRRPKPRFVLEVSDADLRLVDLAGNVLGHVMGRTLTVLPGHCFYQVTQHRSVRVPALFLGTPTVRLSVEADGKVPPWPFETPPIERARYRLPVAEFEALRARRTDVPRT